MCYLFFFLFLTTIVIIAITAIMATAAAITVATGLPETVIAVGPSAPPMMPIELSAFKIIFNLPLFFSVCTVMRINRCRLRIVKPLDVYCPEIGYDNKSGMGIAAVAGCS